MQSIISPRQALIMAYKLAACSGEILANIEIKPVLLIMFASHTNHRQYTHFDLSMQFDCLHFHEADSWDSDVCQFIEEIQQRRTITELNEVILNLVIDKILSVEKVQPIKICYNFVGNLTE